MTSHKYKFTISAPGRIVLAGDHTMMYGKHFVLASLSHRTKVKFWKLSDQARNIRIEFPQVNLKKYISLEEVRRFLDKSEELKDRPLRILKYVHSFITFNNMWSTNRQRYSLKVFFFLLYIMVNDENLDIQSFRVNVTTKIPLDAGLGSSSSFMVGLAACFLHWKRLQNNNSSMEFNENYLYKIEDCARFCEQWTQEYECRLDTEVCVFGKLIKSRIDEAKMYSTEKQSATPIHILLVDTGKRQKKKDQERQMVLLKLKKNQLFDSILDKLNEKAEKIYDRIKSIPPIDSPNLAERDRCYNLLQNSIRKTHKILRKNDLTTQDIDNIRNIAKEYNLEGKLTGFGGGFVYIIKSPTITNENFANMQRQLENQHFKCQRAYFNCEGVKIDEQSYNTDIIYD
ncbi:mevalonate kinase-like [Nylanderia fulva]|uniref:mevalonate kinase-like n=1 Tax=Nylanderia fulva TaxID=613905 RepID=UPI0010FBB689|nr:mevalonate kinase-like [Nylanderia fulva]